MDADAAPTLETTPPRGPAAGQPLLLAALEARLQEELAACGRTAAGGGSGLALAAPRPPALAANLALHAHAQVCV
jgi:hypothetical protein